MKVVDSHIHFWDPTRFEYDLLRKVKDLRKPFLAADFPWRHDSGNVEHVIAVEVACRDQTGERQLDWLSHIATEDDRIAGIIAVLEISDLPETLERVGRIYQTPRVCGVRLRFDPTTLISTTLRRVLEDLASRRLVIELDHFQLAGESVADIAADLPAATFVLNHMGKPNVLESPPADWRVSISMLARQRNIYCKVSGLLNRPEHRKASDQTLSAYVRHVCDAFGPRRLLFGGDWPVVTRATRYDAWLGRVAHALGDTSDTDAAAIFRGNARNTYALATWER